MTVIIRKPLVMVEGQPRQIPDTDTLAAPADVTLWGVQGGGWRDVLGLSLVRTVGPNRPTRKALAAGSVFELDAYVVGDWSEWRYLIQHDYAPGTPVHLRVHWIQGDATAARAVRWELTWSYARGYARGAFDPAGAVVHVESVTSAVARDHHVAETGPLALPLGETDGVLLARVRRVAAALAPEYAADAFLLESDVHCQATHITTRERNAPFEVP